jgi:hypothetical protein
VMTQQLEIFELTESGSHEASAGLCNTISPPKKRQAGAAQA